MSNRKAIIIHSVVVLIKRHCIKMSQYLPKPYRSFGGNINVKVDLPSYAKKSHLKNET